MMSFGRYNDPVLVNELVAYQGERLPSGLIRYSAPSGQHDDCVMALAMVWSAVAGQCRMAQQGLFDYYRELYEERAQRTERDV